MLQVVRARRGTFCIGLIATLSFGCKGTIKGTSSLSGKNGPGVLNLSCASEQYDPGPMYLRRLTNREYAAAVRDVLGVDPSGAVANLPLDQTGTHFDNDATSHTISTLQADGYRNAASDFASQVFASAQSITQALGCDPSQGDRAACTSQWLQRVGRRLYRRPLLSDELARLTTLADSETDAKDGASLALQGMLQSPNFLFRVEIGTEDAARAAYKLSGYEIATRLAFFLWGTTPDDTLLDAAQKGELDTDGGVASHATRMLTDARAKDALSVFTEQWFDLDEVAKVTRSTSQYPLFDDTFRASAIAEAHKLLDEFMWKPGANFMDVYTAPFGFVDTKLAQLYSVTAPQGSGLQRVDFPAGSRRGGLLTTAALLTATARNNFTSPIQRGKFVRSYVLCDPPPAPPPNVPSLTTTEGQSTADAEALHTSMQPCASCHLRIDPIGHGLERYDSIGALRTAYSNGQPVKESGTIEGIADSTFHDGVELGAIVHDSDMARSCVVKQLFSWAMGRPEAPQTGDTCTLEELTKAFSNVNGNFVDLVLALVQSDAFRYRRVLQN